MRRLLHWFQGLWWPARWLLGAAIAIVLLLGTITVSATTWEYTNSPEFCGTTCHTMPPEYAAYQTSPHARVACVDCHLGKESLLLTVPRKAREISHVVNALTQAYEPPLYVKSLRPARDTCEKCHNPDKFSSDTFVNLKRYAEDEVNSETENFMIVKTGGGTQREGLGRGIHWHIENEVWYYTDDPLKQTIPYVKEIGPDGKINEYFDAEAGLPPDFGQQVEGKLERMDCIDCHNRISHLFRSPAQSMDEALARHQIDPSIPFIKEKGVEALEKHAQYTTPEEHLEGIKSLAGWYQENYPEYYAENQDKIEQAIIVLKDIFTTTVFPNMKVGWETHPNNLGHKDFPGCFRCHDGKHTTTAGQTVRLECNLCHSIPEVVEPGKETPMVTVDKPNEPDSHLDSNWLARHRYQFDETCTECHNVDNPGGTDNSSFCSNSGCHASEWKFVGLNAPTIRAMVEPPKVPGTGQPRPVPHPITERTDCQVCHASDSVRPYPDNHAQLDQSLCTLCHQPSLAEGQAPQIDIPTIPHLAEGQEAKCMDCHAAEAVAPAPANHAEWDSDLCLFCHQVAEKTAPAADAEGKKKKAPRTPHAIEGEDWADCLMCHQASGIKPFPAGHEEKSLKSCKGCHKPEEAPQASTKK